MRFFSAQSKHSLVPDTNTDLSACDSALEYQKLVANNTASKPSSSRVPISDSTKKNKKKRLLMDVRGTFRELIYNYGANGALKSLKCGKGRELYLPPVLRLISFNASLRPVSKPTTSLHKNFNVFLEHDHCFSGKPSTRETKSSHFVS